LGPAHISSTPLRPTCGDGSVVSRGDEAAQRNDGVARRQNGRDRDDGRRADERMQRSRRRGDDIYGDQVSSLYAGDEPIARDDDDRGSGHFASTQTHCEGEQRWNNQCYLDQTDLTTLSNTYTHMLQTNVGAKPNS